MFLDTGPLLARRLLECCPTATDNIFHARDLADVKEASQVTPALHLVLHSYGPASNDGSGGSDTRWREIWLVVAVVKNARQNVGAQAIRDEAPPMLREVLAALDGWRCPGAVGLVRAIDPPRPLISKTHGYFPLAFEVFYVPDGAAADY